MDSFKGNTHIASFRLLRFLFFSFISITQFPPVSHGCNQEEKRALLHFKSSLHDPSNRLSSWQEGKQHENCCNWHGIRCSNESFHVTSIDLRNRELEIYIEKLRSRIWFDSFSPPNTALQGKPSPLRLPNITHLKYLDLGFNDFQGSQIQKQFSDFRKLTHLDLSYSNFSESISTQFTNLHSLRYLDLSCGRYFYTVSTSCLQSPSIQWVRTLVNVKVLRLSGIDLYKATSPQENFGKHISYLSNLKVLDLSSCNISGPAFPINEFQNLSKLSYLNMSNNNALSSPFPVQLANLTSLSILDLSSCNLQGLLPCLPRLQELDVSRNSNLHLDLTEMFKHQSPKLQSLSISYTEVTGPIPDSISNAPLLVRLSASWCSITGSLPSSIYNLYHLQLLDLSTNNITSHIDSSISNLKALNFLDLSGNNIQGHIPQSVCKLLPLRQLSLNHNNISGTVPSCVTKLRDLSVLTVSRNSIEGKVSLIPWINKLNPKTLDLSSNKLTVVIDKHLNMTKFKLENLELKSCKMKGPIPTSICHLIHLRRLDVSDNNLTGNIYSCISGLKNLQFLDLSNNTFCGLLPLPPQGLIDNFDVSNNKFSGEISLETGKRLSNAVIINLSGNELSGSIPFSICSQFSTTAYLDLSNNKLSGLIPTSIGYCSFLFFLNLGTNNLTGNVPNELEQARFLTVLLLNANNLNGTLLKRISNFQELVVLNLENNNFVGSIPATIGSLNSLNFLSLRSNKFNGSIPKEILHLQKLRILDLSINNFSGYIPNKLGNLTGLLRKPYKIGAQYNVQFQMVIKGILIQFEHLHHYTSGIDISRNNLEGNLPKEISSLKGLAMLNLSYNSLTGDIPENVGKMSRLESLDLSFNRLSGHIPQSLASIDSLGVLNLSCNRLSGRIPRGAHFETLSVDGSAFVGNKLLCGIPTKKVCEGDQSINPADTSPPTRHDEDDQENAEERLFLSGAVVLGFIVGFWGLFLVLLIKRETWWFGYWRFVDSVSTRCLSKN